MAKFFVFLLLILGVITANARVTPEKGTQKVEVKFISKNQLEDLIAANPNLVELSRNVKKAEDSEKDDIQPRYTTEYYVGSRVAYDYLVARDGTAFSWPDYRDVQLRIDYPAVPGTGRIVTYASILVSQNSASGRAYVTAGGIGYRYITIVVEAETTNYFEYDALIYGRD